MRQSARRRVAEAVVGCAEEKSTGAGLGVGDEAGGFTVGNQGGGVGGVKGVACSKGLELSIGIEGRRERAVGSAVESRSGRPSNAVARGRSERDLHTIVPCVATRRLRVEIGSAVSI